LRLLLVACLVFAVVLGMVATVVVASRSSATDRFTTYAEPLVVDLQQLYTALDDADATVAAAYLSGPVIDTARRDEYDADIARAESLLTAITRAVAGDDAASAPLAAIAAQVPVYTGLVATAQTANRQATVPQPLGIAYLNEASTLERLTTFRETVSQRVHARMNDIAGGRVAAPDQLSLVATHLLAALINHEYQHDQWISEVRSADLGRPLPPDPDTDRLTRLDGYLVLNAFV